MGIKELKKGDVLHSSSDSVKELEIVLKGAIRASNPYGGMVLKTGCLIGGAEKAEDTYFFTYEAETDATVYSYDYSSIDDIVKVIKLNQKIAPVLASSSAKAAIENVLYIAALLSANLGVINLNPYLLWTAEGYFCA